MKLTLLNRDYCSLCQQMLDALAPWQADYDFTVDIINIDDHPTWLTDYDEKVPVLLYQDEVICYWHFDAASLQQFLDHHQVAHKG